MQHDGVVPEGGHCSVHQAVTLDEVHGDLREGAGVIHTLPTQTQISQHKIGTKA